MWCFCVVLRQYAGKFSKNMLYDLCNAIIHHTCQNKLKVSIFTFSTLVPCKFCNYSAHFGANNTNLNTIAAFLHKAFGCTLGFIVLICMYACAHALLIVHNSKKMLHREGKKKIRKKRLRGAYDKIC